MIDKDEFDEDVDPEVKLLLNMEEQKEIFKKLYLIEIDGSVDVIRCCGSCYNWESDNNAVGKCNNESCRYGSCKDDDADEWINKFIKERGLDEASDDLDWIRRTLEYDEQHKEEIEANIKLQKKKCEACKDYLGEGGEVSFEQKGCKEWHLESVIGRWLEVYGLLPTNYPCVSKCPAYKPFNYREAKDGIWACDHIDEGCNYILFLKMDGLTEREIKKSLEKKPTLAYLKAKCKVPEDGMYDFCPEKRLFGKKVGCKKP